MPSEVEQINPTTFRVRFLEDEVEIGDIEAPVFIPHAKLKRWGEECSLGVIPAGEITEVELEVEQYKVKSKYKVKQNGFELELESEFEGLDPGAIAYGEDESGNPVEFAQNRLGAFEFNIVLPKKPPTNKLVFDIETEGLVFYYQPPLHPDHPTWAGGALMPWNAVGSYAVYHATKRDHILGQTNYMCGKAFHIYCPEMVDDDGWIVRGILDLALGKLTVEMPEDFWNNARYPVRHAAGLRFGYETDGSAGVDTIEDSMSSFIDSPAVDGTGISITASVYVTLAAKDAKCCLYIDGVGDLTRVANGETEEEAVPCPPTFDGWNTWDFLVAPNVFAATTYCIFIWGASGSGLSKVAYDVGAPGSGKFWGAMYDGWPATITSLQWMSTNRMYSIYVIFAPLPSAAGGGAGGLAAAAGILLT